MHYAALIVANTSDRRRPPPTTLLVGGFLLLVLLGASWFLTRGGPVPVLTVESSTGDEGGRRAETESVSNRFELALPQAVPSERTVEDAMPLVRVRGPDGAWVASASVEIVALGMLQDRGYSDANGWFAVKQALFEPAVVVARKGDLAGRAVAEPPGAGDMTTPVVVELQGCGAIRGVVVDGAGNGPISSASVCAVPSGTRPRSLSRASRAAIAVEAQADELGRFELRGLRPDTEYRLHAVVRGHLGEPQGVLAVASSADEPIDSVPLTTIEVFPVCGALVQFIDAASGRVLPDSFSQSARLSLEGQPGELLPLEGLALDELELPESVASGNQAEGLRAFLFSMRDADHPREPLILSVEAPDFLPARANLVLSPLSPSMEVVPVSLQSAVGAMHPITLRIQGFPKDPPAPLPSPCQVHLDLEGRGTRSLYVALDEANEVHLMLPQGTHRVRFEAGGGAVVLPSRESGGWKSFAVAEPCSVELLWPPNLQGVVLDVRDADGIPEYGALGLLWTTAAGDGRKDVDHASRILQSAVLSNAPYWLPGLAAGRYEFWLDQRMSGPGYRIEIPEAGTVRVKLVRPRPTAR